MQTKVDILAEGYTRLDDQHRVTSCANTILVRDGSENIVIDPGSVKDFQILVDALAKRGLTIADISKVGLTHLHIDHCKHMGSFPNAAIYDRKNANIGDALVPHEGIVSPNVRLVETPGHTHNSVTFLVGNTRRGVIAICGDTFWRDKSPECRYHQNPEVNRKSAEFILANSDYVIPGHGKMFASK